MFCKAGSRQPSSPGISWSLSLRGWQQTRQSPVLQGTAVNSYGGERAPFTGNRSQTSQVCQARELINVLGSSCAAGELCGAAAACPALNLPAASCWFSTRTNSVWTDCCHLKGLTHSQRALSVPVKASNSLGSCKSTWGTWGSCTTYSSHGCPSLSHCTAGGARMHQFTPAFRCQKLQP